MSDGPRGKPLRWLVALGFVLAVVAMVLGVFFALAPIAVAIVLITSSRVAAGIVLLVVTIVLVAAPRIVLLPVLDGKTYRVPSPAMEPTLHQGDRFYALGDKSPKRGELFVFHPPAGSESSTCGTHRSFDQPCARPTPSNLPDVSFVKRVVALPAERVKVVENRIWVNGRLLREPYARTRECGTDCNLRDEVTVPADHYFMVGDNRGQSADSRLWGPVPRAWLLRRAVFRYWPLRRLGSL